MQMLTDANVVACPEYAAPAISVDSRNERISKSRNACRHTVGEKFKARGAAPH